MAGEELSLGTMEALFQGCPEMAEENGYKFDDYGKLHRISPDGAEEVKSGNGDGGGNGDGDGNGEDDGDADGGNDTSKKKNAVVPVDAEEQKLYDMFSEIVVEKVKVKLPYLLKRNLSKLKSGLGVNYMHGWITSKDDFYVKCNLAHRELKHWPNSGKHYVITNVFTKNCVILLNNGFIILDNTPNPHCMSTKFLRWLNKVKKNYQADLNKLIKLYEKDGTKSRVLDKYYLVPYMKGAEVRVWTPVLREYPDLTNIRLQYIINQMLDINYNLFVYSFMNGALF